MAFEDVMLTDEERAAAQATYFKWTKGVGEKFMGKFVRSQEQTGQYAKKGQLDYVFKYKDEDGNVVEGILTGGIDIQMLIKKAKLQPGDQAIFEHTADKDIGKDNPVKLFKMKVERAGSSSQASKPPPPPPKPADEDDINF